MCVYNQSESDWLLQVESFTISKQLTVYFYSQFFKALFHLKPFIGRIQNLKTLSGNACVQDLLLGYEGENVNVRNKSNEKLPIVLSLPLHVWLIP